MKPPFSIDRVRSVLGELFGVEPAAVRIERAGGAPHVVAIDRRRLVLETTLEATTAAVESAAERALAYARTHDRRGLAIVFVPKLGDAARRAADRTGIGIVDLAGNASIRSGSTYVHVEGRRGPAIRIRRRADLFAPRARRVAAALITRAPDELAQNELARLAGLDEGRTSRLVRELIDAGYVERTPERRLRLVRRDRLIEAFRDSDPFSRELPRRGTIAARSNDAVVRAVRELLESERIAHAATGVLGAHALLRRPPPRPATFYVERMPTEGGLTLAGFLDDERRANVILVVGSDRRVLDDASTISGLRCASALDVYADLAGHPEGTDELAHAVRGLLG